MIHSRFFKILVGIKILIAFVTLLVVTQKIYIGEIRLTAEEAKPTSVDPKLEAPKSNQSRKSFLDDLLNLPALDPNKARKDDVGRFLTLAERKRAQVDERIAVLEKKEQQLVKLEQSIDRKILKIDEERRFVAQSIQQEKDLKGERLTRLIDLYDKMEPKKAAPLFEKMDRDLAVALMKALKQKQVTTILEFMDPEKSVQLSEYFGRVRSLKEYDLLKELNQSLRQEFQECRGMPKFVERDASESKVASDPAFPPEKGTTPSSDAGTQAKAP